ncbi:hypothetical protein KY325_00360 [Candidatus Woesearchaeota archaeon]|nr:hypothetical protein [Candidatus Woesearchaeota archaeon]MBW3017597.1 hypothetical protein [Candidatus Woesearchaeota archaeon]
MKKFLMVLVLLALCIGMFACAPKKPSIVAKLTIEELGFASIGEDNKVQMDVISADTPLFLYVKKIGDFSNPNGEIQPKVSVEIVETQAKREFFGSVIKTEGKSMDSSTFPLGALASGTYTVKIIAMDLLAGTEASAQKQLIVP